MAASDIVIRGAREHNLRDVDLVLPRNKLIVMTGVSGSGKSSLAFDTLYAEGQRRYVESLSTYARQFLGQMPKPDVDTITGLAPSISIQQKATSRNPRSTVGTITEIYDYLRVLYARVGQGHCVKCGGTITAQSTDQILESIAALPEGTRFQVLAPLVQQQKGEFRDLFADLLKQGFLRARVDGEVVSLSDDLQLKKHFKHTIEVVIDRLVAGPGVRSRLAEAVESALRVSGGTLVVSSEAFSRDPQGSAPERAKGQGLRAKRTEEEESLSPQPSTLSLPTDRLYSAKYACPACGISYEPPSPQLFSFNSPLGMCPDCIGLGMRHEFLVDRLIPDPTKSIAKGAFELLGAMKEIGRWRRHLLQGAARAIEQDCGLAEDSFLKTPWQELPDEARRLFLYGMGERHVTFSWKHSGGVWKHGGKWTGLVNDLLDDYRKARNSMRRRQLEKYMETVQCSSCGGARLNAQARNVRLTSTSDSRFSILDSGLENSRPKSRNPKSKTQNPKSLSLSDVCALPVTDAARFFESLVLDDTQRIIAEEALKEIRGRIGFLLRCGLDYLTLDRSAPTLSGGESQRIRLAGQIGCGLVGVVYILDEPSIGLHPRDNTMLLDSLCELRDMGNTVIVVEHDEETMRAADHIVDFGPGPGVRGGEVVVEGDVDAILQSERSLTGAFLSGRREIAVPQERRPRGKDALKVVGARHNNLQNVDVEFPLGQFICVTGVSGSGKSSLVNDILWEVLNRDVNGGIGNPGSHTRVNGLKKIDKAIDIDQSPIGRTPRSNPATYTKLFDEIRSLYTQLPQSKMRGYKPGRFSFNVPGGRCEACEGHGATKLEMDFLADIWVPCAVCEGKRFNHETLEVKYKEKSIAEVLDMDVQEALEHFRNHPKIAQLLQTLHDVGLDYMKLGQPSPTLSGGEAQRVKLARELGKRSTGKTVYLLDEPTTGLHFADVDMLLKVLHGFADAGNTVIVVEHNLDVLKTADWLIDLGPEGGSGGGQIIAEGTPEDIAACEQSHTGRALRSVLCSADRVLFSRDSKRSAATRRTHSPLTTHHSPLTDSIHIRGAAQHNLQHIDLTIPRDRMSVFCGPSGSGKSSLAMDTLYAEGQRRYVESLSAYARQFLGQMPKPKVEHIHGLSPAIAIEQKTVGNTPRSTVGTVTEIYDYLRVLFARLGQPYCPDCGEPVQRQTTDEIVDRVLSLPEGTRLVLAAPIEPAPNQSYEALWQRVASQGYMRVRINGVTHLVEEVPEIDQKRKYAVEAVIDRIKVDPKSRGRIADSIETALDLGRGVVHLLHSDEGVSEEQWRVDRLSLHYSCRNCPAESQRVFEELTPQHFSFNSPLGWCPACEGLGTERGTNLATLIPNPNLTLREGAVAAWPNPAGNAIFMAILEALHAEVGLPLDVPYYQLDPRQQRIVLYGTGDRWISVQSPSFSRDPKGSASAGAESSLMTFRIQYKGLYPAIEEASHVSYSARQRLMDLVGETVCSVCQGDRIRDDAAAVRLMVGGAKGQGLRAKGQGAEDSPETDPLALNPQLSAPTLPQLCRLPLSESMDLLQSLTLGTREKKIAGDLLHEATHRLSFLIDVGLHYLTLDRTMPTLSGGESQRIRLAGQIGRALTGVLYVLDEPTIGLHPKDNSRLIGALTKLRDLGNTVVLVEHDREVIEASDRLYDFGPGAGRFGGTVTAEGSPREIIANGNGSLTGAYLSGAKGIPVPLHRRMQRNETLGADSQPANGSPRSAADQRSALRESTTFAEEVEPRKGRKQRKKVGTESEISNLKSQISDPKSEVSELQIENPKSRIQNHYAPPAGAWLEITGCRQHNLRSVDLRIPLGTLTCITGVSGSGKSSLIMETLARAVARKMRLSGEAPGPFEELRGVEQLNKVIVVDQQPLGSTPASNPATYTGVFDLIRELFARVPDAKVRGYRPGRFSFNRAGGRCEDCEGMGQKKIEMHFLPDVWVECTTCRGKRFNLETLGVKFRGRSIADVLEMSIGEALELFENIPAIRAHLATLCAIGLDYLTLGQSAPTLSGGEAQRVKLAAELSRPHGGKTLYLLDEPTTGLHFDDIAKLLKVLNSLVEQGNTVVIVEHNLDVIKTADWIVDLGPEAGADGGYIVAEGTPEDVVAQAGSSHSTAQGVQPLGFRRSYTGELLSPVLASDPRGQIETFSAEAAARKRKGDLDLRQVGKDAAAPWQVDGRKWHTVDRLSHTGRAVRWEGEALGHVIDVLAEQEALSAPNWNHRSIVEVMSASKTGGWFLHAQTGDEWLLTLKFRVKKGTFDEDRLLKRLALKPLDDLDELPVYGRGERVKVKNLKGPFQEVSITVHWLKEVDTPAFAEFLQEAVQGFLSQVESAPTNPDDITPWKVLGRKWHLSRKGFPTNKRVAWDLSVLDELVQALESACPQGRFDWTNKQVVYVFPNGAEQPWAELHTKRRAGVDLTLLSEPGQVAYGRIATFGAEREIAPHRTGFEAVKIRVDSVEQVRATDLQKLLRELASRAGG